MKWVVFGDKGSGAFSTEAALAEAEAPYEFREVSLERNEQREPTFLAINPSGKIPAVQLPEGGILTETLAILVTIDERFPSAKLLPERGTFARAQALRWLAFMASEIYPMVEISDYPARFVPEGAQSEALRGKAGERIRARLAIVEQAVAGPWLLAEGFSAADIYAAMFSRWSEARKTNLPKLAVLSRALAERPRIAPLWNRHFPPRT
jgi:glutathione S-transferase